MDQPVVFKFAYLSRLYSLSVQKKLLFVQEIEIVFEESNINFEDVCGIYLIEKTLMEDDDNGLQRY